MASQTRFGRNIQAPIRLADEQWRVAEEIRRARREARRGRQIREQHPVLAQEDVADNADGVQVQGGGDEELMIENEDNDEVEIGEEEGEELAGNEGEEDHEEQGIEDEDEYGNLLERGGAEVPGARVTQPEEECLDGWHMIDKLGAEECFHCTFSTMQDVPGEFQLIWTQAWATVLRREAEAESSLVKERALKWFCFLSQGLLRTPRRGAKAGRGAVAKRFRAVVQGDWGSLVTMWQSDVA